MVEKGLTGIREDIRGFVGSKPAPKRDQTIKGRPRIKFCLASGKTDENAGKFPVWRFCIGYDKVYDDLKGLHVGSLVKASGWLVREWVVDEYYKPVINSNTGNYETREYLMLYKAEICDHQKKPALQPELITA